MTDQNIGRLRFLLENSHASPFEHCGMTIYFEGPIFIAREWQRHRVQSFSELSQRYAKLEDLQGYVPGPGQVRTQVGKPGAYKFEASEDEPFIEMVQGSFDAIYEAAFTLYDDFVDRGLAREVARAVLPIGTYTSMYATATLRGWLNFLQLRNAPPALQEFREVAERIEDIACVEFPHTYKAWCELGRRPLGWEDQL